MAEGESCCVPQRESPSIPKHSGCCRPQAPANGANTKGMRLLDGGTFLMGWDSGTYPEDGEGPVREVRLAPFYIDMTSVTNKQFDHFVKATGYKTEAERFACIEARPRLRSEFGGSRVCHGFLASLISAFCARRTCWTIRRAWSIDPMPSANNSPTTAPGTYEMVAG